MPDHGPDADDPREHYVEDDGSGEELMGDDMVKCALQACSACRAHLPVQPGQQQQQIQHSA